MQYIIKSGILYQKESQTALVKMKSVLVSSLKKIQKMNGEVLLETSIRNLNKSPANAGDVRNKEYILTDSSRKVIGCAHPGYAEGESPDETGWPICRLPGVDHALVSLEGKEYVLTMLNSQNYSLTDASGTEVLRIIHKGITGGWILADTAGFTPEILCGMFIFCRYIEMENEFLIV